jgi:hypothetical protein
LWINVIAVVLCAWPIAELGRAAGDSAWLGFAAGLAWLLWVPTSSAALADFRPMVFWVPAVAWMLLGLYRGQRRTWILATLLFCAAREESSYILVLGGLCLLFVPWGETRRRDALALMAIGASYLAFLLVFKDNFFFHFDPRVALASTQARVPSELMEARQGFLLRSWLGGFALAPLSPAPLAIGLGPLYWLLSDTHREWHPMTGTTIYLRDLLLPLLACAGVVGAAKVARGSSWRLHLVAALLILGNLFSFGPERRQMRERYQDLKEQAKSQELAEINQLLGQVRPDAKVGTDYRLIAALSGRRVLWNVAHLYLDDAPPPHWQAEWPLGLERLDTLVIEDGHQLEERLLDEWAQGGRGGTYVLWERVESPPGGVREALP